MAVKLAGILSVIALAALPALAADGESSRLPPSISVTGTSRMFVKPNLAIVNLGVVTQAPTAAQALSANTQRMSALMKTVALQGVPEKDVQTSNLSIEPQYSNSGASQKGPPRIAAYQVSNNVTIKARKLDNLGALLDAVVTSGANQVNGISFTIDRTSELMDSIRKEAIADAHRKASMYAEAGAVQLGKPIYITEEGSYHPVPPSPVRFMATRADGAGESVPISSGEEELTLNISVVYSIQ